MHPGKLLFKNRTLYGFYLYLRRICCNIKSTYTIQNDSFWTRIVKDIQGSGHRIIIGKGCRICDAVIRIRGKNNTLIIGENCYIGPDCSFWMEGENIQITVGDNTTFTRLCHLNAQENNSRISVGTDCMFSNNIILRTSDSHPIFDIDTGCRVNGPADVTVKEHVWVCPNTKIMKGSEIGPGSIIGSDSTVSKTIPSNVLAVGRPASVVRSNVKWTRESLF